MSRLRGRPDLRVLLVVIGMTGLGLWLELVGDATVVPAVGLRLAAAVLAFALAEAVVLHIGIGRDSHSVSFAEAVLVVALFLLPAADLPLARLLGGLPVLLLLRRTRPMKVVFNAALWVLDAAVATTVFHALQGTAHGSAAAMVLPATLAALAVALVDSGAVDLVISLTGGQLDMARALRLVGFCLLTSVAGAAAGLVCVGALLHQPWLLGPTAVVGALGLFGFHRFTVLSRRHSTVQVLHELAVELSWSADADDVVRTVLQRVSEVLHVEQVRLYLEPPGGAGPAGTHLLLHAFDAEQGVLPPVEVLRPAHLELPTAGTVVLGYTPLLQELGLREAVVAPLRGGTLLGALVVGDRLSEVGRFEKGDVLLLDTIASHAAAALSNAQLVEQLDTAALHDSLTGLANRAMFQQQLLAALRGGTPGVTVMLMDLDRFKEVNDTLGHHHGDLLLQETARRLTSGLRATDVLARLGGDEFAVLLTGLDADASLAVAEQLLGLVGRPVRLQGVEMEVHASIGVVHAPSVAARSAGQADDERATVLLQHADVAMYAAKRHYTGVQLYDDALASGSPRRLALAGALRGGIEQGQLTLRYQPQARVSDGRLIGAEALVRWEHPVYGEVQPDEFVPIAEQTGQIRELTHFVLDTGLRACAGWRSAGRDLCVSVNLSVRNLLEPDLVEVVGRLLQRHALPGTALTLEITESHLMADPQRTAEVLHALAGLGVRLSVDDFGTGYSSLAYLKQLPVSEVKVDKSFVFDLSVDDEDAAIVEAIIQLAHTLHLSVVAEGVEDLGARARLAELGCDVAQGYLLSHPLREQELEAWMGRHHGWPDLGRTRPQLVAVALA